MIHPRFGELRRLLEERIADHRRGADRWTHEKVRTSEDDTGDAPLLPEDICANEAERHAWRAEVLQFIRDHVEVAETYRLSASDLDFGELLPRKPGWLEQEEYEERTGVGFMLERATKAVDRLAAPAHPRAWSNLGHQLPDEPRAALLLEQGADPNVRDAVASTHGWTPLMAAAWEGHARVLVELLKDIER